MYLFIYFRLLIDFFMFAKKVKKAKCILGLNKINVKRIDLLDEENQKQVRGIEETRYYYS